MQGKYGCGRGGPEVTGVSLHMLDTARVPERLSQGVQRAQDLSPVASVLQALHRGDTFISTE